MRLTACNTDVEVSRGIDCQGCQGADITDNMVWGTAYEGIVIDGGDGGRLVNNTVSDPGINQQGVELNNADEWLVMGNTIRRSRDGLRIYSDRNHVERNLILDNDNCGLSFWSSASDNVFRGNTARGNVTDFCDDGTNNTSHGDNYMPNQM